MNEAEKRVKLEEFGVILLGIEDSRQTYTKRGREAYEEQKPAWEGQLRKIIGDMIPALDLGELDELAAKILEIGVRYAAGNSTPPAPPSGYLN